MFSPVPALSNETVRNRSDALRETMIDHKKVADLVKVNGKWDLSFFIPSQPAFKYDDMEGKRGMLYAMQCREFCKIGLTTDLNKRFKGIVSGTPFEVTLVGKKTVQLHGLAYAEAWMHKQFAAERVKNEWFKITPEQASEKLRDAGTVAAVYSRKCREWFYADRKQKANDPEYQARMKKEYEKFMSRYGKRLNYWREPMLQEDGER